MCSFEAGIGLVDSNFGSRSQRCSSCNDWCSYGRASWCCRWKWCTSFCRGGGAVVGSLVHGGVAGLELAALLVSAMGSVLDKSFGFLKLDALWLVVPGLTSLESLHRVTL